MPPARVPLHRSLIVRLLATSVLVVICAVAATAWLTVQTTSQALQQQQSRPLSDDAMIYDTLLGYAATHPRWDGVAATVAGLSRRTGRRVVVLTPDRRPVADSTPGSQATFGPPSASIDPLHVEAVTPGAGAAPSGTPTPPGGIDQRVTGPYRLSAADRAELLTLAELAGACMDKYGFGGQLEAGPDGWPILRAAPTKVKPPPCVSPGLLTGPMPAEAAALAGLTGLTERCLGEPLSTYGMILPSFAFLPRQDPLPAGPDRNTIDTCIQSARREQLKPFVAPPVLLFVTDAQGAPARPSFRLSGPNVLRIAQGAGLVLALTVTITILVGLRLVRPLRLLTEAARRPIQEQRRVAVTTRDEIGHLATALNDLSDRREMLEQQRRALVSDVAHELRTPLTNIRSWLEAAQDGVTPADPQLLELLLDEAVLLGHVIDDLRDLAAADAGTLRLHLDYSYVNDVLSQVVDAHRGAAEAGGVQLATAYGADLQMSIDPVRLRQLVGNLVSNAVQHTGRGGQVTIRTGTGDGQLAIEVTDTGEGIDPAAVPMVFERFWRADTSRTRSTGGSGLGLAIARQLARAHDGDITVTSQPGIGSTFTVRLPLSRQAPASTEPTGPVRARDTRQA
jgi:signal transduction histidine kinase